ncbi:MAG: hypothetical protein L6R43_12210 [Planctomycetes bacterium]|nr:hypothetical protein [Planctomycetota bacterium]
MAFARWIGGRAALPVLLLAAGALPPAGPAPAAAAEPGLLRLGRVEARFGGKPGRDALDLEADFDAPASLASFDPARDPLVLSVAGRTILRAPSGTRSRVSGKAAFDVEVKARGILGPRSAVRFLLRRSTGTVSVRARRVDLSDLRETEGSGVEVSLSLDGRVFATLADLEEDARGRWTLPEGEFVPTAPGGGSGGLLWSLAALPMHTCLPGPPQVLVFREASSWNAWWNARAEEVRQVYTWYVPPSPPKADFSKEMFLVIGLGPHYLIDPWYGGTSHNYYLTGIRLAAAGEEGDGLLVTCDLVDWSPSPLPAVFVPGDQTHPTFALKVTRRNGGVEVRENLLPTAAPPSNILR